MGVFKVVRKKIARWRLTSDFADWIWRKAYARHCSDGVGMTYWPLHPTDSAEYVEGYAQALERAMRDPQACNIAVSGRYGAGKSSFLRTFFKDRIENILWISLASFVESSVFPKPGAWNYDAFARALGNSIVQQMFYTARQDEIPFSRFKRISRAGLWRYVGVGVFAFFACVVCLVLFDVPPEICNVIGFAENRGALARPLIIFAFSLVGMATLLWIYDLYKRRGFTISVGYGNTSVGVSDDLKGSVFNKYIDELVYYFQSLHYEAVVFEDIDRFDDPIIFTRLREINQLLNNTRQISKSHRPVRFIYAVRDDVFNKFGRVKFFDYIIPIVPMINAANSNRVLWGRLGEIFGSDCDYDRFDSLVDGVAPYLSDLRLLNNICNEFAVQLKTLPKSLREECLLAMIVFKNFFPSDYNRICDDSGLMKKIMKEKNLAVESAASALKEKIKGLEASKKRLDDEQFEDVRELNRYFITEAFLPLVGSRAQYVTVDNKRHDLVAVCTPTEFDKFVGKTFVISCQSPRYSGMEQIGKFAWNNVDDSAKKLGSLPYFERKKIIEDKIAGRRQEIVDECARLHHQIKELKEKTLAELIEMTRFDLGNVCHAMGVALDGRPLSAKKDEPVNELRMEENVHGVIVLYNLLSAGLLAEDYMFYVSMFPQNELEIGDFNFIMSVQKGEMHPWGEPLTNPELVLQKIPAQYFSTSAVRNFNLIEALLRDEGDDVPEAIEQRRMAFGSVLHWDRHRDAFTFSAEYLKQADSSARRRWIEYVASWGDGYYADPVISSGMATSGLALHMGLYLRHVWAKDTSRSVPLATVKYISQSRDAAAVFSVAQFSKVEFVEFANRTGLCFSKCDLEQLDGVGLFGAMLEAHAYEINEVMVNGILRQVGMRQEEIERKNLTSCRRCSAGGLYDTIMGDFVGYLNNVYEKLSDAQTDDKDIVQFVLTNDGIDHDAKCRYVVKQQNLQLSWETILQLWRKQGIDKDVLHFISVGLESLSADELAVDVQELKKLLADLVVVEEMDVEMLERLLSVITKSVSVVLDDPIVPAPRIRLLAREGLIAFSIGYFTALQDAGGEAHIALAGCFFKEFVERIDELRIYPQDIAVVVRSPDFSKENAAVLVNRFVTLWSKDQKAGKTIAGCLNNNGDLRSGLYTPEVVEACYAIRPK